MSMSISPQRLLWCDAEANCHRMSTREQCAQIAQRAERAGIDALIVDVKPLSGEVLYHSRLAPRLEEVDGFHYPRDFDLLAIMIDEGHARGLQVHAAVNVFSEGHRAWKRGPAYDRPEWQVTMCEAVRTISINGQSFDIEWVDPWEPPAAPTLYTSRSGPALSPRPGTRYLVVKDDSVSGVYSQASEGISIPQDGCVVALPESSTPIEVRPGAAVAWQSHPVIRSSAESRIPSFGVFVNPIGPARDHELRIIEEITSGYDIDAIVFDRMRYPNLQGDFSETSREAFEAWLGRGTIQWPEDIFTISSKPWMPTEPGRYYREWLEWRAWQIRHFADEAVELARSSRPGVRVGIYVGSWYESYFDVGVNWGSKNYHAGYWWMTPEYNETGYAELFDFICPGCYYPIATREEAVALGHPEGATVEAACEVARQAIGNASAMYGSLYLREFEGRPERFREALQTALSKSDGVMLFDLVYLEDYGWWRILEELFGGEASA